MRAQLNFQEDIQVSVTNWWNLSSYHQQFQCLYKFSILQTIICEFVQPLKGWFPFVVFSSPWWLVGGTIRSKKRGAVLSGTCCLFSSFRFNQKGMIYHKGSHPDSILDNQKTRRQQQFFSEAVRGIDEFMDKSAGGRLRKLCLEKLVEETSGLQTIRLDDKTGSEQK